MKNYTSLLLAMFLLLPLFMKAQEEKLSDPKNFIKANLSSIILTKNYSFQYERALGKRVSFAVSYRFMSEGEIPDFLKGTITSQFDEDEDFENKVLNTVKIGNYAITPEFRFYFGKGYGRGFYVAPYYRYAKFDVNGYDINFDKDDGTEGTMQISGNVTSHSGGIMFGVQWALGKYIVLDWWIVGAHIGSATGTFSGYSNENLSILEQENIRQEIEDFEFFKKVTVIDDHNVKVDVEGPWVGIRTGISLGVRF